MEERKAVLDKELNIEAYQFRGIMQKFPNHFHEHYVIGFIERGKRKLISKNQEYIIEPGDLMIFNPRDNHSCEQIDNNTLDYRCINIKEDIMMDIMEAITGHRDIPYFKSTVIFHGEQVDLLKDVHEMIMNRSKEFVKEESLLFLIGQLVELYAEPFEVKVEVNNQLLVKTCNYMKENFSNVIKLDQLSAISGLNKFILLRLFTKEIGITPYQYLLTIRINKAKELLESGIEPLDVAMSTGFTDQCHFTNYFKKFIGITPGQYRDIFKERLGEQYEQ